MPRFSKRTFGRGRPRKGYARIYKRNKARNRQGKRMMRAGASSLFRPTHYFARMSSPSVVALTSNTAGNGSTGFINLGITYQLSSLINAGDFSNLYDQYKIISATHFFKWSLDPTISASIIDNPPTFYYFTDHDDSSAPSHNELLERASTKIFALKPNKVYKINVKPAVLQEVYKSSVTTGFIPKWGQYLDMVDSNTPHFGLKVGINYGGLSVYGSVQHWYRLIFACKGVR